MLAHDVESTAVLMLTSQCWDDALIKQKPSDAAKIRHEKAAERR